MVYRVDCSRWGRFFQVPCSVVDEHIKLSDGEFIKVLLCILCGNSNIIDTDKLSGQAGVSVRTVEDSLRYWAGLGVISLYDENGGDVKAVGQTSEPCAAVQPKAEEPKPKTVVRYSPKDLSDKINKNGELKLLTDDVQRILGRTINATETAGLLNLYEYYGFSAASILMITDYCHKLGKDRFAYIERVAKDWFERGITSYSDVENEIIAQSKTRSYEYKTAKAFGINSKLSKRQQEYIDSWRSMGFSIEMLEIAYEKCMDAKNTLSFSYIDGIVKNWAGKSISTPEQVSREEQRFADSNKKKKQMSDNGGKSTSYDLDEWEQYAMNFDPNRGGDKQ